MPDIYQFIGITVVTFLAFAATSYQIIHSQRK